MVRAGEESGKLDQTFLFLADYIDRSYEVASKVRNGRAHLSAIHFIVVFIAVMILMLVVVIPNIGNILTQDGGTLPVYTQITCSMRVRSWSTTAYLCSWRSLSAATLCIRYAQTDAGGQTCGRRA